MQDQTAMASRKPLAIAGLWRAWEEPEWKPSIPFTMFTVNADEHRLMERFHKPRDEKRSAVIVPPNVYEEWLGCRNTDEARSFLNLFSADEMETEAHPLPPRKAKNGDSADLLAE